MPTFDQWIAMAMMGIGPLALANVFWDKATRTGSVAIVSSLAFLTPLVTILLLAFFGLATTTIATFLGVILTMLGAVLGSRKKSCQNSAP